MSDHEYTPKSNLGKWFNDRLPLLSLANHLTEKLMSEINSKSDLINLIIDDILIGDLIYYGENLGDKYNHFFYISRIPMR